MDKEEGKEWEETCEINVLEQGLSACSKTLKLEHLNCCNPLTTNTFVIENVKKK